MITEVARGKTHTETIGFTMEECCNCGIPFFMPTYHYKELLADNDRYFYCPNGHSQHYTGKTEAQKLREQMEAERIESEKRQRNIYKLLEERTTDLMAAQKQLKRIHKGVCPCCNRSFQNLKKHIETKHPELNNQKQA